MFLANSCESIALISISIIRCQDFSRWRSSAITDRPRSDKISGSCRIQLVQSAWGNWNLASPNIYLTGLVVWVWLEMVLSMLADSFAAACTTCASGSNSSHCKWPSGSFQDRVSFVDLQSKNTYWVALGNGRLLERVRCHWLQSEAILRALHQMCPEAQKVEQLLRPVHRVSHLVEVKSLAWTVPQRCRIHATATMMERKMQHGKAIP